MTIFLSIAVLVLLGVCIFLGVKIHYLEKGILEIVGPQLDAHEKALQLLAKKLHIG